MNPRNKLHLNVISKSLLDLYFGLRLADKSGVLKYLEQFKAIFHRSSMIGQEAGPSTTPTNIENKEESERRFRYKMHGLGEAGSYEAEAAQNEPSSKDAIKTYQRTACYACALVVTCQYERGSSIEFLSVVEKSDGNTPSSQNASLSDHAISTMLNASNVCVCKRELETGEEFYLIPDDGRLVCKNDYELARDR
ncbi:hypothetical protein COOONC_01784 [Cooperia oncophora]